MAICNFPGCENTATVVIGLLWGDLWKQVSACDGCAMANIVKIDLTKKPKGKKK